MQNIRISLPSAFLTGVLVVLCGVAHAEPVSLTRHGDTIDVEIGGKPFTTYSFDPNISKAFLEPLRDAKGTIVTRTLAIGNEIPPGHEHDKGFEPHQRGMYFGHGNIDGYSFWIEEAFKKYYSHSAPAKYGRMVFRKLDEMKSGPSLGVIRATFDLEGPGQEAICRGDSGVQVQRRCGYAGDRLRVCDQSRQGAGALRRHQGRHFCSASESAVGCSGREHGQF